MFETLSYGRGAPRPVVPGVLRTPVLLWVCVCEMWGDTYEMITKAHLERPWRAEPEDRATAHDTYMHTYR